MTYNEWGNIFWKNCVTTSISAKLSYHNKYLKLLYSYQLVCNFNFLYLCYRLLFGCCRLDSFLTLKVSWMSSGILLVLKYESRFLDCIDFHLLFILHISQLSPKVINTINKFYYKIQGILHKSMLTISFLEFCQVFPCLIAQK